MAVVAGLCIILTTGCGRKADEKDAEKMMGKVMTEATGKETRVDLRGGDVHVENKEMKVDMVSTSTWPADMFADVPRFTGGAIERVVTSREGGKKNFNIHFGGVKDDAVKRYAEDLKAKGWEATIMEMGKGRMLSAQKGDLGVTFTYSAEKMDGMLAVFSAQ